MMRVYMSTISNYKISSLAPDITSHRNRNNSCEMFDTKIGNVKPKLRAH